MPNQAVFDHVHFLTDDVEGLVTMFKDVFGATEIRRMPRGDAYMVHLALGPSRVVVSPGESPGTTADHIAVATPDLDGAAQGIVAGGGRVEKPLAQAGPFRVMFVRDVRGVLMELVDPPTV